MVKELSDLWRFPEKVSELHMHLQAARRFAHHFLEDLEGRLMTSWLTLVWSVSAVSARPRFGNTFRVFRRTRCRCLPWPLPRPGPWDRAERGRRAVWVRLWRMPGRSCKRLAPLKVWPRRQCWSLENFKRLDMRCSMMFSPFFSQNRSLAICLLEQSIPSALLKPVIKPRKSVLGERADLFEFAGDTIELTEAGNWSCLSQCV